MSSSESPNKSISFLGFLVSSLGFVVFFGGGGEESPNKSTEARAAGFLSGLLFLVPNKSSSLSIANGSAIESIFGLLLLSSSNKLLVFLVSPTGSAAVTCPM